MNLDILATQIDIHFKKQESFNKEQATQTQNILNEMSEVKRALYGDEKNLVLGLMERQLKDEVRLTKLENTKKHVIWFTLGAITVIETIWKIYTHLTKID
jgi:hypothetical protein